MNAVEQIPIQITETALIQLNRIREEQGIPLDFGLRVGVRGGGCSGFSYTLGFDSKKNKIKSLKLLESKF